MMEMSEDENNDLIAEPNDPTNVYTLDFSTHHLHEVPKCIHKYTFCKSLNLSCNGITSIKKNDFSSCLLLKELKLYSNKLSAIKGLDQLEKLEDLQLQYNCISSVGKSLKNNRNLMFLRLDSNRLSVISVSEFCMLSKLTYLDLSSNKLDDISCVNALASLERLYCTHNFLTKLPNLFGLKKLKEVDFSNNRLVDLGGLKGCDRLEIIIANVNKIGDLKSLGCLKSLQELKICDNCISNFKHISEQFNALEVLEIADNKVKSSTQINFLFKLSMSLKELCIYGNPMFIDVESKTMIHNMLENNMQLHLLDRNELCKERNAKSTPCVMRPMSASQMVSQRSIKDQIEFSAMQMDELEEKIKLQFDVLKDLLSELPSNRPKTVGVVCEIIQRPSSRCSSRARLNDARAFAEKHFEMKK